MKYLFKIFSNMFLILLILFFLVSCNNLVIPGDENSFYTYTGYSSTSDGRLQTFGSHVTYSVAHDFKFADELDTSSDYSFIGQCFPDCHCHYCIRRSFVYFDTSSIPENAIISNAILSLYFCHDECVSTDFDIVIQNGQPIYPHEPLEVNDFYYLHYSGNGGSVNTNGLSFDKYTNIFLNVTGISWIQKGPGAKTKLALISSRDIDKIAPSGDESIPFFTSESGNGYRPKLVIHYTLPE